MNKPSLDELMRRVDSKYTLVVAAAKRARAITEAQSDLTNPKSANPVSIALKEISEGAVQCKPMRPGK